MKPGISILLSVLVLPGAALAQSAPTAPADPSAYPSAGPSAHPSDGMTLAQFEARGEQRMMAADTNGDGRISKAEFVAAAKPDHGDPAKRFDKLDLNADGMLDKSEIDAMLEHRFKRLDTNGDGIISPQERSSARDAAGKSKPDS